MNPIAHGGLDFSELRRLDIDAATLIDFSVCVNPFGPSPRVPEALAKVRIDQYPDRDHHALRAALSEEHGVPSHCIVVGNGATELIGLAALAFIRTGIHALAIEPTYGEYARSIRLHGGGLSVWTSRTTDGFAVNASEIQAELARLQPAVVFLCNPNNPTGVVMEAEVVLRWARRHPRMLFIVDEAYHAFAGGLDSLAGRADNVLVLRSMTKDHALAGLRIGYAVGAERIITKLRAVSPPWSVNSFAQAAALASLQDSAHLAESLRMLADAKADLTRQLTALGLDVWPSATHYFLVRGGDAAALRLKLLRRGVLVRDCASFGLPEFVRVATRRPDENARLLTAWREVL